MNSNPTHHLAQYNVARLTHPLDDPRLADFVANLDRVNTLGDRSPGFVWRLHDATGNSTGMRVGADPMVLVNMTVWESAESLFEYTYRSDHADVFRRRKEWFEHDDGLPYLVLWWVPTGHEPTIDEGEERLAVLRRDGPTPGAFTLKDRFPAPA